MTMSVALFDRPHCMEAGAPLSTADGKEAGYVTRAARIRDPPRIIGMGYVRKEAEAPASTPALAGRHRDNHRQVEVLKVRQSQRARQFH